MANGNDGGVTQRGGGAGWFVAGILAALLAVGGFYLFNQASEDENAIELKLELPDPQ